MGKKHISTEIFTYVLAGSLIIIFVLCGGFLKYQKDIVQEKINTSITGLLNQTSNSINDKLARTESLARYLKLNATLNDVLKREPNYDDALAIDRIISDMGNSRVWSEEYITIVGERGHLFVNWDNDGNNCYHPEIKRLNERIHNPEDILYEIPFEKMVGYDNIDQYDKNKKLIGVASFIEDYAHMKTELGIITVGIPTQVIINMMEQNRIYEESEVYLLDRDGTILLSSLQDKVGTVMNTDGFDIRWTESSAANRVITQDGNKMMAFYQPLNSDWAQMILIPYPVYMREIRVMVLTFVGVAVLAAFLALLISLLVSYSISKPIKELEQSMDQINSGNFKNRVRVSRKDDIGKLGIHFNAMANNLEKLIEERIETQKHTSELIIANKTAELKMLHAQINPHFLFNTLNSIRCIAIINKSEYLAHMLESLGALLENSIMKGRENTSIEMELSLLKKYIELQQMRYGKRLKAEFMVDEEIYGNEIPRFMLQPLTENAIIHGISAKVEGGTIRIKGSRQGDNIRLVVEDDGVGVNEEKVRAGKKAVEQISESSKHGIGLSNIRERLELIYGKNCELSIIPKREDNGTLAILIFPAKKYEEESHA